MIVTREGITDNIFWMIQSFADWLTYNVFSLTQNTKIADAANFFVYDSIKIILLLLVVTHFMSLLRFYLPIEKLRSFLASHNFFGLDYFLAAIFGAITPFCSCSSIPFFVGFLRAGIPLGITFSFLITSPLVNEVALTLFVGLFGWKVTITYLISGILIGVGGGAVLGKMKLEKYVEKYIWEIGPGKNSKEDSKKKMSWQKAKIISKEALGITKKISLYVLIGVGVGALIHGFVPESFFGKYITKGNPFAVPLAVILAVPLYSNASGVIPVIQSLVAKGIPLGTAMAFMMATVGLSLPEALILRRAMKLPLLLIFFGIVTLGIILMGYGFNLIF